MKRTKRHILLGCILLAGVVGYAQPHLRVPEIYFGIHGGISAATVQFSPTVPNMTPLPQAVTLGGNGGFLFRWSGQKCCAVQVELNYLQRGWREDNENGAYERKLHYVELPFLMHIYFGSSAFRGFVNLGPQIGYCVYDDNGRGNKQDNEIHQYIPIERPFDWGIAGGLGFYYRSKQAGLYQLEIRYNYSLGTLFDPSLTAHFRNSNPMELSVNVAWLWEFKPKHK